MNIMSKTLACSMGINDRLADPIRIYPLPHMSVLRNLMPDLTNFFAQHASMQRAKVS